jgi:hypothetical protein
LTAIEVPHATVGSVECPGADKKKAPVKGPISSAVVMVMMVVVMMRAGG